MEYQARGLSMNNGSLGFEEDDLLFNYGVMPGAVVPSNGPLSSSASSYASSFGPHTPSSGTATPPRHGSFDFNATRNLSFDSNSSFAITIDTNSFELTPPSSTTSSYFPNGFRTDDGSDLYQPAFPLTPSRSHLHAANAWENQLSPTQPMDYYYPDGMTQHNLMSTPPGPVSTSQTWDYQWGPKWVQGDSPIDFENNTPTRLAHAVHGLKLEEAEHHEFETKKRILIGEAKLRATALQQAQQQEQHHHRTGELVRVRTKSQKQTRTRRDQQDSDIGTITRSMHPCTVPDCKFGPYRRSEHLKRHYNSKHRGDSFKCESCGTVVNRHDNYIQHMGLHAKDRGKTGRVKFDPNAIKTYEEARAKTKRKSSTRIAKTEKRPSI